MFDRRAAALAIVAALSATAVRAQTLSPRVDSLLRQVRLLDSSLMVRSHAVDSVRRALVRPVPPVEIRRGPLSVRTVTDLEDRVRPAVDSVAALIDRAGGATLASRVKRHAPTITPDSAHTLFGK